MDALSSIRERAKSVLAPAKVNLSLHVIGRRPDGYHRLDGLVAFTALGDRIAIEDADVGSLSVVGPMAAGLSGAGNLLDAALGLGRAVAREHGIDLGRFALTLEKTLPVAAGLGGGSADAAALLGFLAGRYPVLRDDLFARSVELGADVPMCLLGLPARVGGIGEIVQPLAEFPALPIVLVNPRVAVSTPAVFSALETASNAPPPPLPAAGFAGLADLCAYLAECRNDLQPSAQAIAPPIGEVIARLREAEAALVRMSGSGATVFALFATDASARGAAAAISAERPDWWVAATSTLPRGQAVSENR